MEVVRRINSDKTKTDTDTKTRELSETRIAMALTQVFSYMLLRGITYGYVAAGKALVLLHVKFDNTQTLHYHLCAPGEGVAVSETVVAKLLSFCLLSFQSKPIQGVQLQEIHRTINLERWPHPYDEAERTDSSKSVPSPQEPKDSNSLYEGETCQSLIIRVYPKRARVGTCRDTEDIQHRNDEEDDGDDDANGRSPRTATRMAVTTSNSTKRKAGASSGSSPQGSGERESSSDAEHVPTWLTSSSLATCTRTTRLSIRMG